MYPLMKCHRPNLSLLPVRNKNFLRALSAVLDAVPATALTTNYLNDYILSQGSYIYWKIRGMSKPVLLYSEV